MRVGIFEALRRVQRPGSPRPGTRRYLTSDLDSAFYSLISADPPIFYVAHWMNEETAFMASLEVLFDHLAHRPAYFLYNWWWHIDDPRRVELARRFEREHRRRYRSHRFIHCCNSRAQEAVFREKGLDAVFCSQNCLVDERIFRPLDGREKEYDAVYDGRFKAYKRQHLASHIQSLGLIYDFNPEVDDRAYVDALRQQLAHAHFFNHPDAEGYTRLSAEEVNAALNRCAVGLCLSSIEGAMYSSIQYLLAGLPVVSTRSLGGRDVFFDDEYVRIVEDDPAAVAAGVRALIERQIPAELIRAKTLERVNAHRRTLISLVQSIYEREAIRRDFASEWDDIFFNTMIRRQSHAETIERLGGGRGVRAG